MTRSVTAIAASLRGKKVPGWALGKRGGVLDLIWTAIAHLLQGVERDAEELMNEIDPRLANRLLPDFERVLGPDPCGRDIGGRSISDRQKIAHQRWTAEGGQSIPFLMSVAEKLGYRIVIEEFWPSVAGGLRAGQRLVPKGEQFSWRVRLEPVGKRIFRAGAGRGGDRLVAYSIPDVECELRRIAHAHTTPVFTYDLEEVA